MGFECIFQPVDYLLYSNRLFRLPLFTDGKQIRNLNLSNVTRFSSQAQDDNQLFLFTQFL